MGHTTHSVARAKPYLEVLGAGRRRGHIYIYMVALLNAMVSLSISATVAQAI
jgi:hypothetical protein